MESGAPVLQIFSGNLESGVPPLPKPAFPRPNVWIMGGGGGEHIYIYIHIYIDIDIDINIDMYVCECSTAKCTAYMSNYI